MTKAIAILSLIREDNALRDLEHARTACLRFGMEQPVIKEFDKLIIAQSNYLRRLLDQLETTLNG